MDFDNKVFGETLIEFTILKFRGIKRINIFNFFPLNYYLNKT